MLKELNICKILVKSNFDSNNQDEMAKALHIFSDKDRESHLSSTKTANPYLTVFLCRGF